MRPRLRQRDIPLFATALVLVLVFAYGAAAYPGFASWGVARNLLVDNAFLGVAGIGATFVILAGGIDLSVGSVMAFTSILVATLVGQHGVHPLLAFGIALAVGGLFGLFQGLFIQLFSLPAFLVTLAGMFLARGAAFAVYRQSLGITHPFVAQTLNDSLSLRLPLGPRGVVIPVAVFIFLFALLGAWYLLRHTRSGRAVYALGDDEHAAALMGLPVARTRIAVYTLSGFLSALAGITFCLYQQSGDPAACKGLELDAIAAVVIGGTLLRGGIGSVLGTAMGVLILGLIQTVISFQGDLSSWWTRIAVGLLVLLFLALQRVLDLLATRALTRGPA
jgi:simple sugar transport system permease protein